MNIYNNFSNEELHLRICNKVNTCIHAERSREDERD